MGFGLGIGGSSGALEVYISRVVFFVGGNCLVDFSSLTITLHLEDLFFCGIPVRLQS